MQVPCRGCGRVAAGGGPLCPACAASDLAPELGLTADPGLAPVLSRPGRLVPGDLTRAIAEAPPGAVLTLAPGLYVLSAPLQIMRALRIEGAGAEQTRIVGLADSKDTEETLLHVHLAEGTTFALTGLTLAAEHRHDLLRVTAGRLALSGCRLEGPGAGGDAVSLAGDASLEARDTEVSGAGGCGIRGLGATRLVLTACALTDHGDYGLFLGDHAAVEASALTSRANGRGGLAVEAEARLLLHRSTIAANGRRGLLLRSSGECRLEENAIAHNAGPGVEVGAATRLTLVDNDIRGNRGAGMMLGDGARAEARGNACEENAEDGVAVYRGARAQLVGNGANHNGRFGIWVGSGGEADLTDNAAGGNRRGEFMAAFAATLAIAGTPTTFGRRSDRSPRPQPTEERSWRRR